MTYSTIDSRVDPHEGMYFRFAQEIAGIGGDARFIRTTADARIYKPLFDGSDVVGVLKATGGNITGLGQPVTTTDDFFKGGETIRGFASLGYGPRYYDPANGYNIALGGKNYVNGTAEVQFPLPAVPPDFGLRGAFFADAGILWGADVPSGCAVATCNPATRLWTTRRFARRSALRSSGPHHSVRSAPISPGRSPRRATTPRSSSVSAPAPLSSRPAAGRGRIVGAPFVLAGAPRAAGILPS